MKEFKPTKEQLLRAMEDLEDGTPITADMRAAVNRHMLEVAHANVLEEQHRQEMLQRGQESDLIRMGGMSLLEAIDDLLREPPQKTTQR